MFLFSTPLFINGLPVDYSVSKENEFFNFEPIFNPHNDLVPPSFTVTYINDRYQFGKMVEEDIKAQVEEIIKEYLSEQ
jgi:hypothetical protein